MRVAICTVVALLAAAPVLSLQREMATWCNESEAEPRDCLTQLVEQWKQRGKYGAGRISTQLSKAFAIHPDTFFEVLAEHRPS